ncbi:MAG TPA: NAD(P)-dependent oxidoreductase [Candidatus Saccharimonas sp.]|nr:NAD(P)-dependent oxidoreductase [Candidatus Saccharimonas sp.]
MKILVTGAAGKLGAEVVKALAGHEVVQAVRTQKVGTVATQIELDLSDLASIEPAIAATKPDTIIHLAAVIGEAQTNPDLAKKVNADATAELAKASAKHGVRYFLFASTAAVYAQNELLPTDEDSNIAPAAVYGQTKLAAEQALANSAGDVKFIAFRIFNVYGPTFTNSLVYKLAKSTPEQPVQLNGFETFYRDYVHVNDVVRALVQFDAFANLPNFTVMNIAGGRAVNNKMLVEELTAQGVTPHYDVKQAPASYSWADITRAQKLLGFKPAQSIIW